MPLTEQRTSRHIRCTPPAGCGLRVIAHSRWWGSNLSRRKFSVANFRSLAAAGHRIDRQRQVCGWLLSLKAGRHGCRVSVTAELPNKEPFQHPPIYVGLRSRRSQGLAIRKKRASNISNRESGRQTHSPFAQPGATILRDELPASLGGSDRIARYAARRFESTCESAASPRDGRPFLRSRNHLRLQSAHYRRKLIRRQANPEIAKATKRPVTIFRPYLFLCCVPAIKSCRMKELDPRQSSVLFNRVM